MEERNNLNNNEWYRPAETEQVTDLFEEAGLYKVKSREELYAQNAPKKRKGGWIIAIVCVAVLIGAIVLSAKVFGGEDNAVADAKDFFDAYSEFYDQYTEQDDLTGEYPMDRADPDPDRELKLANAVGTEALTLQQLYAKCLPSVVGINTYQNGREYAWGTGVIMTSDGYVITNAHVLDDGDAAEVILSDGTVYPAKLVGADSISDIALLKVEATAVEVI